MQNTRRSSWDSIFFVAFIVFSCYTRAHARFRSNKSLFAEVILKQSNAKLGMVRT